MPRVIGSSPMERAILTEGHMDVEAYAKALRRAAVMEILQDAGVELRAVGYGPVPRVVKTRNSAHNVGVSANLALVTSLMRAAGIELKDLPRM